MKEKRHERPDILRNSTVHSFANQIIHPPYTYMVIHTYVNMCTCKCRFCNIRFVKNEGFPIFTAVDIRSCSRHLYCISIVMWVCVHCS